MGEMPSSMRVPLLDARITRIQEKGSAESELMMPKRGIWQHAKKMKRVIAVHNTFSLNWIFLSGFCISGSIEQNGFTNSRNLIPILRPKTQPKLLDYFSCRSESSNKSL